MVFHSVMTWRLWWYLSKAYASDLSRNEDNNMIEHVPQHIPIDVFRNTEYSFQFWRCLLITPSEPQLGNIQTEDVSRLSMSTTQAAQDTG